MRSNSYFSSELSVYSLIIFIRKCPNIFSCARKTDSQTNEHGNMSNV